MKYSRGTSDERKYKNTKLHKRFQATLKIKDKEIKN